MCSISWHFHIATLHSFVNTLHGKATSVVDDIPVEHGAGTVAKERSQLTYSPISTRYLSVAL